MAAPEEAIFLFMNALLDPVIHVVCARPRVSVAPRTGPHPRIARWPLGNRKKRRRVWRFDPAKLEKAHAPQHQELVVWNFPHNPTGALPTQAEFRHMLAIAQEAGLGCSPTRCTRLLGPPTSCSLPAAVDPLRASSLLVGDVEGVRPGRPTIGWLVTHDAQAATALP